MKISKLEDFIAQMPKELPSITHKARTLYIELGKRSFYDRDFESLMFGEEEQYSIYSDKIYASPNIIVCTTLIKQYKSLLDMVNIRNKILIDNLGHYSLVYYDENGQEIFTDLTQDLKNIQFNCRTSYFGKDQFSDKTIRDIDILIGYITNRRGYSDDYWDMLKQRLDSSKLSDRSKLELTLASLKEFGDLTKLGEAELASLYNKFVKYCIGGNANIAFYSIRSSTGEQNFVELREKNKIIRYKLNKATLEFELDKIMERGEISK